MTLPALILRLESLAVAAAAVALYIDGDYALWPLLAFLVAPDLSFAAYLAGPRVGPSATTSRTRTSCRSRWLQAACSPEKPGSRCRSR